MFRKILIAAALLAVAGAAHAVPMNFSFQGNFSQDDNVQLFNFSTDGSSTVYLVSYGYGGGIQADGTNNTFGGMDTILTLFDSAGNQINGNDDGSTACFGGAQATAPGTTGGFSDPNTGVRYDTCLSSLLTAGTYTVAVSQYNNFSNGSLGAGFAQDGTGNFTGALGGCSNGSFCDVTGSNRTNYWAYDILNVESAVTPTIAEPAPLALIGLGLLVAGLARRRTR